MLFLVDMLFFRLKPHANRQAGSRSYTAMLRSESRRGTQLSDASLLIIRCQHSRYQIPALLSDAQKDSTFRASSCRRAPLLSPEFHPTSLVSCSCDTTSACLTMHLQPCHFKHLGARSHPFPLAGFGQVLTHSFCLIQPFCSETSKFVK
jgi:hypothetical protein